MSVYTTHAVNRSVSFPGLDTKTGYLEIENRQVSGRVPPVLETGGYVYLTSIPNLVIWKFLEPGVCDSLPVSTTGGSLSVVLRIAKHR